MDAWLGLWPIALCLLLAAVLWLLGSWLVYRQRREIYAARLRTEAELSALNARAIAEMLAIARATRDANRS